MFGIVIDDQTTPYIYSDQLDRLPPLVKANQRLGHSARLVVEDPECLMCDQTIEGCFEVDGWGDWAELPLHRGCEAGYHAERAADE
jgi:hypothetical protein